MININNYQDYINDSWWSSLPKEWKAFYSLKPSKNLYLDIFMCKDLNLERHYIPNLKGLEYSVNITSLNLCDNIDLDSLDGIQKGM